MKFLAEIPRALLNFYDIVKSCSEENLGTVPYRNEIMRWNGVKEARRMKIVLYRDALL